MNRMLYLKKRKVNRFIFFCLSVVLLSGSFHTNRYKVVYQDWFADFSKSSESLVIGRLLYSEHQGIIAGGGLTGRVLPEANGTDEVSYQYEAYLNNATIENTKYAAYKTQPGGQGMIFSILNQVSPFNPEVNLFLFQGITALLTASAFSFFLLWVWNRFNFTTTVVCLILVFFSPWITVFGRIMWWQLWAFYLPFLSLLFFLNKEFNQKNNPESQTLFTLFWIAALSLGIKCWVNGFEYISTTLLMFCIPLLLYFFLGKWKLLFALKRLAALVAGALCALVFNVLLLSYQIALYESSSLKSGLNHILYSFFKRSTKSEYTFTTAISKSLEAGQLEVLSKYLKGAAFGITQAFDAVQVGFFTISFAKLFLLFFVGSILCFLARKTIDSMIPTKIVPFIAVTWVSILAPLSWHILFKGHSYLHVHLNFIVWYMPFCLFGFVITGILLSTYGSLAWNKIRAKTSAKTEHNP